MENPESLKILRNLDTSKTGFADVLFGYSQMGQSLIKLAKKNAFKLILINVKHYSSCLLRKTSVETKSHSEFIKF